MKLSSSAFERAKKFIYENARMLERRRYEYFFEGGSKEAVLSALSAYQNQDGGFGNALEPDIRCPQSQPVPTEVALTVMDEIELFDPSIIEGIARYLKQITIKTGGFPLAFRNLNDYPHAPWWTVQQDEAAHINPTGRIIGLLLKQKTLTDFYQEEWFQQTMQYIWNCFDKEEPSGYHDGVQWISFLEQVPERSRAETYLSDIDKWLSRPGTIERDPNAEGYVHKVLDWASTRDSYAAKFISEEDLETHLSYLVNQQQEDGGWPLNWPAVSPAGGLEWRGWITVQRLKTLQSYGWL